MPSKKLIELNEGDYFKLHPEADDLYMFISEVMPKVCGCEIIAQPSCEYLELPAELLVIKINPFK